MICSSVQTFIILCTNIDLATWASYQKVWNSTIIKLIVKICDFPILAFQWLKVKCDILWLWLNPNFCTLVHRGGYDSIVDSTKIGMEIWLCIQVPLRIRKGGRDLSAVILVHLVSYPQSIVIMIIWYKHTVTTAYNNWYCSVAVTIPCDNTMLRFPGATTMLTMNRSHCSSPGFQYSWVATYWKITFSLYA